MVKIVNDLTKKFDSNKKAEDVFLTEPVDKTKKCHLHNEMSIDDKKKILLDLDDLVTLKIIEEEFLELLLYIMLLVIKNLILFLVKNMNFFMMH